MFTYQLVELELQGLYEAVDIARTLVYSAMITSAAGTKDPLCEMHLKDAMDCIKKIKQLEAELKIKIARLKSGQ